VFGWIFRGADRLASIHEIAGHHVYWRSLHANPTVVDLGGNVGRFTNAILRETSCRVIYVEADPKLCRQVVFPKTANVEIRNLAMGDTNKVVRLFRSRDSEATSTSQVIAESRGIEGTFDAQGSTLEALFSRAHIFSVDVLKVDIEGSEVPLLSATHMTTFEKIGQITVEFHDFLCPQYRPAIAHLLTLLRRNGWIDVVYSLPDYHDVLLINGAVLAARDRVIIWLIRNILGRLLEFRSAGRFSKRL
jgi:FkbM family methyltransferase